MGANQLIVNHQADILFHPKQILDYLPQLSQSEAIPSVHLSNLSEKEQEIIDLFNQRQLLHFDEMLNSIQISVADLTHRLLLLEMSNHIECLPGKYYRLNRNILVHFSGER